jgi:hypothetical protein
LNWPRLLTRDEARLIAASAPCGRKKAVRILD